MPTPARLPRRLRPALLLAAVPALAGAREPQVLDGTQWAQLTIHERVIIRIPRVAAPMPGPVPGPAAAATLSRTVPTRWKEKRAPRCVDAASLTGASVDSAGDLDLIVSGTKRLRAKLEDECRPMDFYSGFYLKPSSDGKICARRDTVRTRAGAHCAITAFRTLIAER